MPITLTKSPLTPARLSLGRSAPSIATADHLDFQLDHARARDAVHAELDTQTLADALRARNLEPLLLRSAIEPGPNARRTYLRRPDLGRTLRPTSLQTLTDWSSQNPRLQRNPSQNMSSRPESLQFLRDDAAERPAVSTCRLAIILADGLSALALERHAVNLLDVLLPLLSTPHSLLPVALATNARVALADPIGERLAADITILLIGERPGLSSPDSLGVYLTWNPRPGRTDAERNCISNIRPPAGLSYADAAHRILHYLTEAARLQTTGILLKDPTPQQATPSLAAPASQPQTRSPRLAAPDSQPQTRSSQE